MDPTSRLYGDLTDGYVAKYKTRTPQLRFFLPRPVGRVDGPVDGVVAHPVMEPARLAAEMATATRSVRVLDTGSSLVGGSEFRRAALEALEGGARIKILLMEPDGLDPAVGALRQLQHEARGQNVEHSRSMPPLEIRLYDRRPDVCVHQIDDRIYVKFLADGPAVGAHLETHRQSNLGAYAVEAFQRLWEHARPLAGLRYLTVTAKVGPAGEPEHMLVRAWRFQRSWLVASHRIERLLRTAGQVLTLTVEGEEGEFELADTPYQASETAAWRKSFFEIFLAADPGPEIHIRQLTRRHLLDQ